MVQCDNGLFFKSIYYTQTKSETTSLIGEKFYSCFAYVNLASGKENVTDIETLSEDTLVFILRWCEKLREINKKQYRILFENEVYNIICVDDVQFTHKKLKLTAVREIRGGKNEQTGDI